MRHRHRGVLAIVSVVVLVIAVSLIGWRSWSIYLPDPAVADGPALLRWLVLKELADEPWQQQVVIVDRLAAELHQGIPSAADATGLSRSRRERLLRNLQLAKRIWFQTRVDRYASCPPSERWGFVSVQVETVLRWTDLSVPKMATEMPVDAPAVEPPASRHTATMEFFSELEGWIAAADSDRAEMMRCAVQAGLTCWLATHDLAVEPLATRGEIARRIILQLESGLQLNQVASDLDAARQEMLKANGLLLMEAWLNDQAETYASLPAGERTAYVDQRLDQVERWGLIQFLSGPDQSPQSRSEEKSRSEGSGVVELMNEVNTWIERASPERQQDLRALVGLLQQRIFCRSFQSLLN